MIFSDVPAIPSDEAPFMGDQNIKMMIEIKKAIMASVAKDIDGAYGIDRNLVLGAMNMGIDNSDHGTTPISSVSLNDKEGSTLECPIITIENSQFAVDAQGRLFGINFATDRRGYITSTIALDTKPKDSLFIKTDSKSGLGVTGKLKKTKTNLGGSKTGVVYFTSDVSEHSMNSKFPSVFKSKNNTFPGSFVRRDTYAMKNNRKGFLAVQSLFTHQSPAK
jgi:hypothetical protein